MIFEGHSTISMFYDYFAMRSVEETMVADLVFQALDGHVCEKNRRSCQGAVNGMSNFVRVQLSVIQMQA